jgi:hypothetical protein
VIYSSLLGNRVQIHLPLKPYLYRRLLKGARARLVSSNPNLWAGACEPGRFARSLHGRIYGGPERKFGFAPDEASRH